MATVKLKQPPAPTGVSEVDITELYNHQRYLIGEMNYILNNLDEDNMITEQEEESEEE